MSRFGRSTSTCQNLAVANYPTELELDVVLKDGAPAKVRPVRQGDSNLLEDLFSRLSAETVYSRFFQTKTRLSEKELEYFTHVDYEQRMAFLVLMDERLIAVGRYDKLPNEPVAEVAFVVEDEYQGRGVGTLLLQLLTEHARDNYIGGFRALVLADNYGMMRVFRNSGYQLARHLEDGVYEVDFPTAYTEIARERESDRERSAVIASLLPLFYPNSIAVIGASRNKASIGGRLFDNLLRVGFSGAVYPVNPWAPVVSSVRAYSSVMAIPDSVDLAFIVVPQEHVYEAVADCVEKGVRGVVVISAGFSEIGEETAEEALVDLVRKGGMRMVGPNCMGLLNTDPAVNLNGTFAPVYPPRGNVGMSSQSGALGIALLDFAKRLDIGVSSFVSIGNKADVTGADLLLHWEGDPSTDVIVLYLESFGNPRRFSRIARRVARKKPIVAVKSGRTHAGRRAAGSHTGAMASSEVAVEALFRETGVIRTRTLNGLFNVTSLLANQPVPSGPRVAIVTNAGGPGILAADAIAANELDLVEFSSDLQVQLRSILSAEASITNPVDMVASAGADAYSRTIRAIMDSGECDSLITIYIPTTSEGHEEIWNSVQDAAVSNTAVTTLAVYMTAHRNRRVDDQLKLPTYTFPEEAAQALARAVRYGEWLRRPEGELPFFDDVDSRAAAATIDAALTRMGPEGGWLTPEEVERVLEAYGLTLPASKVAESADDAAAFAAELGRNVVLKAIGVVHKSDVGGVKLDIEPDDVATEFTAMMASVPGITGVLVQEYVGDGHEVIIGMSDDPSFGPIVAFGMGGVTVELMKDVSFRIHPITDVDAGEMMAELKSAPILDGYRGGAPGDVAATKEALLRVGAMIEDHPAIAEMDLNPVKVLEPGQGVRTVDARVRVAAANPYYIPSRHNMPGIR